MPLTIGVVGLSPRVRGSPCPAAIFGRGGRVYPRECGGASAFNSSSLIMKGLSPRVRGSHRHRNADHIQNGSIPASAGEPSRPSRRTSSPRVYPRECGGAPTLTSAPRSQTGLSPRVRGSRARVAQYMPLCTGLSPRVRGSRTATRKFGHTTRVYPRECGGASSLYSIENTILTMSNNDGMACWTSLVLNFSADQKHGVVRHDLFRWFTQAIQAQTAIRCIVGPSHNDTTVAQLPIPIVEHAPYPRSHAAAHARVRVDAGRQFQHGRAQKPAIACLNVTGNDDDHRHQGADPVSSSALVVINVLILSIIEGITAR